LKKRAVVDEQQEEHRALLKWLERPDFDVEPQFERVLIR
jgi:hypothetical protein